jgi:hypothetical protein
MGVRSVQGPQIGGADPKAFMQQMIHAGAANAASRASDEGGHAGEIEEAVFHGLEFLR